MSTSADISRLEASFESSSTPLEPQDRDAGSDLDISDSTFARKCDALIGIGKPNEAEVKADTVFAGVSESKGELDAKQLQQTVMQNLRRMTEQLRQDETFNAQQSNISDDIIDLQQPTASDIHVLLKQAMAGARAKPDVFNAKRRVRLEPEKL